MSAQTSLAAQPVPPVLPNHPDSPTHHDSASRSGLDRLARFAAPLRSTGVDGAHWPVAPD